MGISCYPVLLDLTKQSILVVGGGEVAERKIKVLLDYDGRVSVLSPAVTQGIETLVTSGKVNWLRRDYAEGDLDGFSMVIVATDNSEVNDLVAEEACRRGILVNVVDDLHSSNFIVPASLKRGDIVVAVSTSGVSPALAHKLKERFREEIGPEWEALTILIGEVRQELKKRGVSVSGPDWERALDLDRLLMLIRGGEQVKAREFLWGELCRQ